MEDLIDIQGLDYIGWWPLALGWWVVIAVMLLLLAGAIVLGIRYLTYRRSWQYKSYKRLADLAAQTTQIEPKEILQSLSEEIRKIAMLTTKRESCAGLIGDKWLQWLQEQDPAGFNWTEYGSLLVNVQYRPDTITNDSAGNSSGQIAILISAAQGWVRKC